MDASPLTRSTSAGLSLLIPLVVGCAEHERLNMLLDCSPRELATRVSTPHEAAEIIDMRVVRKADRRLAKSDDWRSLSESLTLEQGDCDDWAIASAALLADDGWPAKLLIVGTVRVFVDTQNQLARRGYCHAVHLLEHDGLYGANGVNRCDRFAPQFASVPEVVRRLPLIQDRWEFYKVVPLDGVDIVGGRGNLFEQVADRYRAAEWIDIEYPRRGGSPIANQKGRHTPAGRTGAIR